MITNDVYRRLRFRSDDPLRYLHVPRRERQEIDLDELDDQEIESEPDEMNAGELDASREAI